jgi:hypothetical protein
LEVVIPKPSILRLEDEFRPTQWNSAEKKLAFANHLLNFIAADFPRKKFTKDFYNRLSCVFGFMPTTIWRGFCGTFFTCTAGKVRFLSSLLSHPNCGDPAYTYSEVEAAVQQKIRELGFLEMYRVTSAGLFGCEPTRGTPGMFEIFLEEGAAGPPVPFRPST